MAIRTALLAVVGQQIKAKYNVTIVESYLTRNLDTNFDEHLLLVQFREAIPFLKQIPDNLYFQLDTSEFYFPDPLVNQARKYLEGELNCFVMTYNKEVFNLEIPINAHLCANLKGATLTPDQLKILNSYESYYRETHPVSFVAYTKPLELIDPQESPIHKLYEERM